MVNEVSFAEMGYTVYTQNVVTKCGCTNQMFPNAHFGLEKASEL